MKKSIVLLLLASLLAACSSNDEIELEPAELVDFDQRAKLKTVWKKSVGAGQDARYTRLVPAVDGDYVYAAGIEGRVSGFERTNGELRWSTDLEMPVSGGAGAGFGLVLVGSYKGDVVALDQSSGSELWRTKVSSEVLSAPKSNGSVVVVQTLDGKLFGLDASNGERLWKYETAVPVLTLRGTGTPVITDTTVFAGFATGKLIALEAKTGLVSWEQRVALSKGRTELDRVVDLDGAPLLVGDILYVSSYQGRILAINRGTGRVFWAKEVSTFQNLAQGNGKVFVSSDDDILQAYNAGNGEITWENSQMLRRKLNSPQTFGSYVAVADFEGYVHVMDAEDGQFVAREKIDGSGIRSPIVGAGDTLYVLGDSGQLSALQIR